MTSWSCSRKTSPQYNSSAPHASSRPSSDTGSKSRTEVPAQTSLTFSELPAPGIKIREKVTITVTSSQQHWAPRQKFLPGSTLNGLVGCHVVAAIRVLQNVLESPSCLEQREQSCAIERWLNNSNHHTALDRTCKLSSPGADAPSYYYAQSLHF